MKILLSEEQYKRLVLTESTNEAKNLIDKFLEVGKESIQNTKKVFGFDLGFLFSYTMGIGALMQPTINFLEGKGIQLNETELTGLIVAAITVVFLETEAKKSQIEEKIKELGLESEFEKTKSFLEKTKLWFEAMFTSIPNMIMRGGNILAYTFLVPVATYLIKGLDFKNTEEVVMVLKHLFANVGINFSSVFLKGLAQKMVDKVKS
jgi:xanthine/uracil permease